MGVGEEPERLRAEEMARKLASVIRCGATVDQISPKFLADFAAEVERLAGEHDDWIAKYEQMTKLADDAETSRMKSEAECKRLAGELRTQKLLTGTVEAAERQTAKAWESHDLARAECARLAGELEDFQGQVAVLKTAARVSDRDNERLAGRVEELDKALADRPTMEYVRDVEHDNLRLAGRVAAYECETCGHPWSRHSSGGMCAGDAPDGFGCYCVLFPPDVGGSE